MNVATDARRLHFAVQLYAEACRDRREAGPCDGPVIAICIHGDSAHLGEPSLVCFAGRGDAGGEGRLGVGGRLGRAQGGR